MTLSLSGELGVGNVFGPRNLPVDNRLLVVSVISEDTVILPNRPNQPEISTVTIRPKNAMVIWPVTPNRRI